MKISKISWSTFDLVGGKTTPLKNMSSAVGMIIPNVMSKTPTSDSPQKMFFFVKFKQKLGYNHGEIKAIIKLKIPWFMGQSLIVHNTCHLLLVGW